MDTDTVDGVTFTRAAAENIRETGCDVAADLAALRRGQQTPEGLLAHCLDGADEDRVQGWRDYVDALVAAVEAVQS